MGAVDLSVFPASDDRIDRMLGAETMRRALAQLSPEHRDSGRYGEIADLPRPAPATGGPWLPSGAALIQGLDRTGLPSRR
jgi:hypothetical protein